MATLFVPQRSLDRDKLFQLKIALAVDMLRRIRNEASLPLCIVADALYAKKNLIRFCIDSNIPFVSGLRSDAALFEPANRHHRLRRGRPAVKGNRLPALSSLASYKRGFCSVTLPLYGKPTTVHYRELLAWWKPAAAVVKVLIVRYPQKRRDITSFFFSTDTAMAADRIITVVAARWSLENAFKDMKQHLGFGRWQCHTEQSVTRSVPLTCVAYSSLLIWSMQEMLQQAPMLWDSVPWNTGKSTIALSDVLYQLKCQCITKNISSILPDDRLSVLINEQIRSILRLAA